MSSTHAERRLAEAERAHAKPTQHLDAYDLYLRALRPIFLATRESYATAHALFARALEIDPDYSLVKAHYARALCSCGSNGWGKAGDRELALRLTREALADHRDDPMTLGLAGNTLGFLTPDKEQALAATQRAVALNPNSAILLSSEAWVHLSRGEPNEAIVCEQRAIRLSPRDQELGYFYSVIAAAHYMAGDNAAALEFALRAVAEMPNWSTSWRVRIAALIGLGRIDEAREAARRFRQDHPDHRVGRALLSYQDQAFVQRFREALIQAGLPK